MVINPKSGPNYKNKSSTFLSGYCTPQEGYIEPFIPAASCGVFWKVLDKNCLPAAFSLARRAGKLRGCCPGIRNANSNAACAACLCCCTNEWISGLLDI